MSHTAAHTVNAMSVFIENITQTTPPLRRELQRHSHHPHVSPPSDGALHPPRENASRNAA